MPIPKPHKGEDQTAWMNRCMHDETMKQDFPDNKQRVAVCLQQWRDKNKKDIEIELQRATIGEIRHRASPGRKEGSRTFVLSDGSLDRHGTVLDPGGWVLDNFKRNPIAFFVHNSEKIVGQWENLRTESGQLLAEFKDLEPGTSALADEVTKLVDQGVLKAASVGFVPLEQARLIDPKNPQRGSVYPKNELLEASLVGVPSNPGALNQVRSMNLSTETMSLVFGEHAEERRAGITTGEHAENRTANGVRPSGTRTQFKVNAVTTLSERIQDVQQGLNEKNDKREFIASADPLDVDALEALNVDIETAERALAALLSAEAGNAARAQAGAGAPAPASGSSNALTVQEQRQRTNLPAPAYNRHPLGFPQPKIDSPRAHFDTLVKAVAARGISYFGPGDRTIERVLDEHYPGNQSVAYLARADQTVGTTTVSGWASELVSETWAGFMDALRGTSIYPFLRDRGQQYSFDGSGTVHFPSLTAGGAGGGFFAEGSPIRVGRVTVAAASMTAYQMGVIIPFTRKLAQQSRPSIESVVRQAIVADTSAILDGILLDATASSSARPAGLLYGVSAAASGFGGGDYQAVIEDFKAAFAPFVSANAADSLTAIMNTGSGLNLAMMQPPLGNPGWFSTVRDRVSPLESTHATANRVIVLRNSDFATALGDAPQFDVSEQATIHMEDTTPLEIVSGSGPTTADPTRSLWQTASVGVRMIMDVSFKMRRSGMVSWIDGTSW